MSALLMPRCLWGAVAEAVRGLGGRRRLFERQAAGRGAQECVQGCVCGCGGRGLGQVPLLDGEMAAGLALGPHG